MANISELPQELQDRLRAELNPGEQVVWTGQPIADQVMKSGFAIWLFFIPWTAFALFWMGGASGFRMPRFDSGASLFPLFGLPFLFIGLAGLSTPLWLRRSARYTVYAVTSQRAIIISGAKTITINSYLPAQLGNLSRTERKNGTGDLTLAVNHSPENARNPTTSAQGFFAIRDVRDVERLVEKLAQTNLVTGAPGGSQF